MCVCRSCFLFVSSFFLFLFSIFFNSIYFFMHAAGIMQFSSFGDNKKPFFFFSVFSGVDL